LGLFGALVGGRYFTESVNLGFISTADFSETTNTTNTTGSETIDYEGITINSLADSGFPNCKMSETDYQDFAKKVITISKELDINPQYLMKVMSVESA
jgi:sulfite reductase beta subunit-like hemoprotein